MTQAKLNAIQNTMCKIFLHVYEFKNTLCLHTIILPQNISISTKPKLNAIQNNMCKIFFYMSKNLKIH